MDTSLPLSPADATRVLVGALFFGAMLFSVFKMFVAIAEDEPPVAGVWFVVLVVQAAMAVALILS